MSTISTATPNLQQQASVTQTAAKPPIESLTTKNADGTYGPKHTLRPPSSVITPTAESSDAVAFDVKV